MPNTGCQALLDHKMRPGPDQGQVSFVGWHGGIYIETLDVWVHICLIMFNLHTETGAM